MNKFKTTEHNPITGISYGKGIAYLTEQAGIPYIRFPGLDRFPELCHGYSTRLGGVSTGHCSTMSFSVKCGDTVPQILENFRRMSEAIGVSKDMLVLTDQVHGDKVIPVGKEHIYNAEGQTVLHGVDGIVTNVPGLTLVCFTADCVPLFFYDPVHRVVGLSHAGWRGTVAQIGRKTLEVMREHYGTEAADVHVVIGPSICAECYEVSEEVADACREAFPADTLEQFLTPGRPGHYQLDLWQANKVALMLSAVPTEQISISGLCTCCNAKYLHSHRATAGKRGLLTGYLAVSAES